MLTMLRSHRRWLVLVPLLAALALPASTLAATIIGGPGNDVLYGTTSADTIYGNDGNDTIYGRAGGDTIYGGADNDRLHGGYGNDWMYGGYGTDGLDGGPGHDHLYGGYGGDAIHAAGDGTADVISCGPGIDYVVYGPTDTFADSSCEHRYLRDS